MRLILIALCIASELLALGRVGHAHSEQLVNSHPLTPATPFPAFARFSAALAGQHLVRRLQLHY